MSIWLEKKLCNYVNVELGNSILYKNNIPDNSIVGNNIFLRPEEAMLKTWQNHILSK